MLHGFGDTGDMWDFCSLKLLVRDHTVIVLTCAAWACRPIPEGGYEKTAQARDLIDILDQPGIQDVALVTHDIGNMVGYALAALFPQGDAMGGDRRAASGDRPLGRPVQKPQGLALQLPRPRCGAAGRGTRTNPTRPFLQ